MKQLIAIHENTSISRDNTYYVAFIDANCIGHFERNRTGNFYYFADVADENRLLDLAEALQHAGDQFIKEWMDKSEDEIFYF